MREDESVSGGEPRKTRIIRNTIEKIRDEEDLDWNLVPPENIERLKAALSGDPDVADVGSELACEPILATIQRLEEDIGSTLWIRSVRLDPDTDDLEMTLEYDSPPIPAEQLARHLDGVRAEISRLIPALHDVVVSDSWALGFDAAISREGDITIYPARGSREWPMNDEEFVGIARMLGNLGMKEESR